MKNRDEIEKAIESLEKGINTLHGVIGRMDAAEDYAKYQREQFYVVKDNDEPTGEDICKVKY